MSICPTNSSYIDRVAAETVYLSKSFALPYGVSRSISLLADAIISKGVARNSKFEGTNPFGGPTLLLFPFLGFFALFNSNPGRFDAKDSRETLLVNFFKTAAIEAITGVGISLAFSSAKNTILSTCYEFPKLLAKSFRTFSVLYPISMSFVASQLLKTTYAYSSDVRFETKLLSSVAQVSTVAISGIIAGVFTVFDE